MFMLVLPLCQGQSIDTTVGGSQALGAAGVQIGYQHNGSYGWTGIGYESGFRFGAYLNEPLRMLTMADTNHDKYRLGIGDQFLNASLTVDEYSFHVFTARGVSLLRHTNKSDLQVFSGTFTQEEAEPYLRNVYQLGSSLMGAIIGQVHVSKNLDLRSLNIVGNGLTSIQSLSWSPSFWRFSTAAGVGANHGYFSNAAEYHKHELDLRASYTLANRAFHRQDGYNYDIEPLGFNAKVEVPIGRQSTAYYNHMHELTIVPKNVNPTQTSSTGTTDSAEFTTSFWDTRAAFAFDQSSAESYAGNNYTGVASLSRRMLPRWTASLSFVYNTSLLQQMKAYQSTNELRVSNHLAVTQHFDRFSGKNSSTFGGRWSSNMVSLSVDNQIYTSQVAAQFGQKSIFQAWTISLRFRTPHGTTTHMDTTVDPFGKMQWGGYLSGLRYHAIGSTGTDIGYHVNFSKYVIQGKVVNERGDGVWGIAINIGGDTVISDMDGGFFTHVKNGKQLPFAVAADLSPQTSRWSLVSAPATAQGFPDGKPGNQVRVVVQMVRGVAVQKPPPALTIQPQPKPTVIPANDQVNDLQMARPVAAQKPAPSLMIETQPKVSAISVDDQVRDLLMAERALMARSTAHSEIPPEVHRPKKAAKVLRVICSLFCFGLRSRTHRESPDGGGERA
jgi:hypothetical protein